MRLGQVKADPDRNNPVLYYETFSIIQPSTFRSKPTELHDLGVTLSADQKGENHHREYILLF